jgi:hypothetical protein
MKRTKLVKGNFVLRKTTRQRESGAIRGDENTKGGSRKTDRSGRLCSATAEGEAGQANLALNVCRVNSQLLRKYGRLEFLWERCWCMVKQCCLMEILQQNKWKKVHSNGVYVFSNFILCFIITVGCNL